MKKAQILIIDDDQNQRLLLTSSLQHAGHIVQHANTGQAGLALTEQQIPDLILLDLCMSEMDGFKFLKVLRDNLAYANVSVIILSALDDTTETIKGLNSGADDYLVKPFNPNELLARIQAVLRRHKYFRPLEGIVEGDLANIDLLDLLQTMEQGDKTGTIFLHDVDGEISIRKGKLLQLRQGPRTGIDALWRLLLPEQGYFIIEFNKIHDHFNELPGRPLKPLLMNATQNIDEIKALADSLNINDQLLEITGDISHYPALVTVKKATPMSLAKIIISMNGKPAEAIQQLGHAIQQQVVTTHAIAP